MNVAALNKESYHDPDIARILRTTRNIAVVGASPNPARHSHRVMTFMQHNGYRIIPINPKAAGEEILGEPVVASLADAPEPVDMVDVFRRQEAVPSVVDEVIRLKAEKQIRYLWLQLDLYDDAAASRARAAGLEVVMDRCLKIEYGRVLAYRS